MNYWFVFSDGRLLLRRDDDGTYGLPFQEGNPTGNVAEIESPFRLGGEACKVVNCGETPSAMDDARYVFVPLRSCYERLSDAHFQMAGKVSEWLNWDEETRYCGKCGAKTKWQTAISKVCPECKREIWPKLSPAVIVLIRREDKVLLVQSRTFRRRYYGLVAGFVELGESLEESLMREVREEVGVEICNLKYFGSQPWPYPRNLMIGFTADYRSGEIKIQDEELNGGGWFSRDNMPEIPGKVSIARRLIDSWLNEFKH